MLELTVLTTLLKNKFKAIDAIRDLISWFGNYMPCGGCGAGLSRAD